MDLDILVPGGTGQLGAEIAALASDSVFVSAPGSARLDVTSTGGVIRAVAELADRARAEGRKPIVVNAAAYTAVDLAESNHARAVAVNADGPRVLAAACTSRGVPLIHVSTDYVFPGDGTEPYEVDSPTRPQSVYGITKLAGEGAVLASGAKAWVVRTSWVYGAHGNNFVKTIARLEGQRETLSVVDDQVGSPTWTGDLARGLVELAGKIVAGEPPAGRVLHCTGAGTATWCGFARAIFEELGADPARIQPCTTEEYPTPAKRPAYSVLSAKSWAAAGLTPMPPWRESLTRAFKDNAAAFKP